MTERLAPGQLRGLLGQPGEIALIDVREQGVYSTAHLFFAVSISLSHVEMVIGRLAPRLSVPIVLCDDGVDDNALAGLAAQRLAAAGYGDLKILSGGPQQWQQAGLEIFSGVNVPSKAFGEFVEHWYDTPRLPASEVQAMTERGDDFVILDSRPMAEYTRMNIPGGIDCPGAELVYRVHDMAPDPATTVIVNCAGRTRSIIGAQSLINAGVPNRVFALKDGTMGWELAGLAVERGRTDHAPEPGPDGLRVAVERVAQVADRFSVRRASARMLNRWRAQSDRTTMLLDVRTQAEFEAGHWPGAQHAPGGQLVQATDEYVATRGARLVILDGEDGVRGTMTAHWLVQLGWSDVWVLAGQPDESVTGKYKAPAFELTAAPEISAQQLQQAIDEGQALAVIDLSTSLRYRSAHIPGAFWAVRSRIVTCLRALLAREKPIERIVLTASDDNLAHLAAADLSVAGVEQSVCVLTGGLNAWTDAGGLTTSGLDDHLTEVDDVWFKPYDHAGKQSDAMQAYLSWEVGLVEQVEREGLAAFRRF